MKLTPTEMATLSPVEQADLLELKAARAEEQRVAKLRRAEEIARLIARDGET